MTYVLSRVTPPAKDPVSLREVRAQLRLDGDELDEQLDHLIWQAVDYYDGPHGYLGRAIISQTWKMTTDTFNGLRIPMPGVQSVSSVQYYDGDNALQTFASGYFVAVKGEEYTFLLDEGVSWPSIHNRPDAVQVTFVCGYGDNPSDVPATIRGDILRLITALEQNPEEDIQPPRFMLASERVARARF